MADNGDGTPAQSVTSHLPLTPHDVVAAFAQWDTYYFYGPIAAGGYAGAQAVTTRGAAAAFFPLYPALVHLAMLIGAPFGLDRHPVAAALVVSNLAALAAFIAVARVVAERTGWPAHAVGRALVYLAAYPFAFFLAAGYAESLLLLWSALALDALHRGRPGRAATFVSLATLTNVRGLALTLPLVVAAARLARGAQPPGAPGRIPYGDALDARRASRRGRELAAGAALALVVALAVPLLAELAIGAGAFGDPLAFLHVEGAVFSHAARWPWDTLGLAWRALSNPAAPFGSYYQIRALLDIAPLALAVPALALLWRGGGAHWRLCATHAAALIALVVASPTVWTGGAADPGDPFLSAGRYLLPAFPLFVIVVARWATGRPAREALALGGGFALQALTLAFFLQNGWLI